MDVTNKKVAFLISSLAGGGAEGVCVNVANGFVEQGWQVDLVVLNLNNAAYLNRLSDKVNLVVLGANHARYSGLPLLKYIRRERPETILVFNYELAVLLVILRSMFRFKTKIIARNINTLSKKREQAQGIWPKYVVKPLIHGLYRKVDHVINQCRAMREDLINLYPKLAAKSSVIYNPVAKHVEEYVFTHGLEQVTKQGYLLCVGRLEKQKAFHFAIEAFASVSQKFPDLRLKIVGQGSEERQLKECAVDFGVFDKVDFEGFKENLIPYYLHANVTVLTSLYEGFPNVLVESIALGTPVVAFDCPSGPKEIVIENINGFLVDLKSIAELTDKLVMVLDNEMKAKAIANTANKNKLGVIVSQYEDLILSV